MCKLECRVTSNQKLCHAVSFVTGVKRGVTQKNAYPLDSKDSFVIQHYEGKSDKADSRKAGKQVL